MPDDDAASATDTPPDPTPALAALVELMPFAGVLGIEVVAAAPESVVATMAYRDDLTTAGGVLHGGAQMAFADSVGAICAVANLPAGATTATIESKTNLLRAVTTGVVTATSVPLHVGRTTIVVQTDLTDDRDRRIAHTVQTQAVIPAATS